MLITYYHKKYIDTQACMINTDNNTSYLPVAQIKEFTAFFSFQLDANEFTSNLPCIKEECR